MSTSPVKFKAIYCRPSPTLLVPKLNHKSICFSRQLSTCSSMTLSSTPTNFIPIRAPISRHRSGATPTTAAKVGVIGAMRTGDSINDGEGESVFEQEELMGSGFLRTASPVVAGGTDLESILNRRSKWIVSGAFAFVMLCRHDGEAVWGAMGSVMNAGLCAVLKRVLNQQRPDSSKKSDPGMPSSHAQSIFYIAVFLAISIVEWLGTNALGLTLGMFVFLSGAYFTWLRVSQKFHTTNQVAVGAIVGSVFSYLWIWLWRALVAQAFYDLFWVRVLVILVSATCCLSFVLAVMRNWLRDTE